MCFTRIANPCLCTEKRNRESQPECDPKELVWRQLAERKEHSDNWPGRRHSQANAVHTNDPLAMLCHFFAPDVAVSLDQTEQEHDREQCGRRRFIGPSNI